MDIEEIQIEIDKLREILKAETATYKIAIREGSAFEVAKYLLSKRKDTMQKIASLASQLSLVTKQQEEKANTQSQFFYCKQSPKFMLVILPHIGLTAMDIQ